MYYAENWDKSKERFKAFWEHEMVVRASVFIRYPKANKPKRDVPQVSLEESYTNPEWILERNLEMFEDSNYVAEGFAFSKVTWISAGQCGYTDGAKYQYAKDTVWAFPSMTELDPNQIVFNENNPVFQHHLTMHKYFVDNANGRYMVGNMDNTGNLDALAHLRGTTELLMDMYDNPEGVKACHQKLFDIQKFTTNAYMDTYEKSNPGTLVPWMGLWCPERCVQAQCDISVMMSPEMFEEFGLPELEAHKDWPGKMVYHFDGMEQIAHLDMMLECEAIDVIQWTPVAGQPKTAEFIPILKKIQNAGKSLVLMPGADEVDILTKELSHKGLHFKFWSISNDEEAEYVIKTAGKNAHE